MKALVFGVDTQPYTPPPDAPPMGANLAVTPVALQEIPDAKPLRPDWYVIRPTLTGICGSDSKQILLDFEGDADSAMSGLCSFPQVMGHEVVGVVTEAGPQARGFEIGQRVVLNPWLSCEPRGITPICPACEDGDFSLCWSFTSGDLTAGLHTGVSSDATGGYAELMPAHSTMLFPVPDAIDDEHAIFADPFAVSLHSVTRHPPPPGGRALVWGAGALGSCAVAILRALHPDVEVGVVARFDAQAAFAEKLGAHKVFRLGSQMEMIEQLAEWCGGTLRPTMEGLPGMPMCHPGGVDVAYDTVGKPETFEVEVRVLKARGTLVKSGVASPGRWEWSPLYFKEISWVGSNAFGIEEVEGVRKHGIEHYLDLVTSGRIDLTGLLTHTFGLSHWQDAFYTIADQERSGAIKVAIDPARGEHVKVAGSIALVTGASSGIGAATAAELARRGASVVVTARRAAELEATADACRLHQAGSFAVTADLGVPGEPERVVGAVVAEHGRVDIVVNNAGITLHRTAIDTSAEDVERIMQINFLSAVRTTMAALPGMVDRGRGSIINVTSVAGHLPNPNESAYGASKAALSLWSHGLGVDLAGTGVHVGELSPGPIDTPIWEFDETPSSFDGKKYPPEVVAVAIAKMIEGEVVQMTVPRKFGAPGVMYRLPLLTRAMRRGLINFERKGQKKLAKS